VVIDWDPVTHSHPEIGRTGPVTISRYQLFVERGSFKLSLDLPQHVTEFEVPMALTTPGEEYKFEIIAARRPATTRRSRAASGSSRRAACSPGDRGRGCDRRRVDGG
jgi:hypothetical protein